MRDHKSSCVFYFCLDEPKLFRTRSFIFNHYLRRLGSVSKIYLMKFYIIAVEASGDLHASNLMRELKKSDASATFRCWGGDLMKAQGGELVKHYKELAFMGFTEVILNLRTILKNIELCKKDILEHKPDVLILVDYPGFNLRIAEFAKKNGIKVFYYISPQVWAWKQSRVQHIKKYVDRMFVILPFEKDFYKNLFQMEVSQTFCPHIFLCAARVIVSMPTPAERCNKKLLFRSSLQTLQCAN